MWKPVLLTQAVSVRAKLVTFDHGRAMAVGSDMALEPGQWIQFWPLLGGLVPGPECQTQWGITKPAKRIDLYCR